VPAVHTEALAGRGEICDGCQLQLELRAAGYCLVSIKIIKDAVFKF